jgi:hypothetical protein
MGCKRARGCTTRNRQEGILTVTGKADSAVSREALLAISLWQVGQKGISAMHKSKKILSSVQKERKKIMSAVGFEPTQVAL